MPNLWPLLRYRREMGLHQQASKTRIKIFHEVKTCSTDLVNEDAETPPIDGISVWRSCQHLRGNELRRAAESRGSLSHSWLLLMLRRKIEVHTLSKPMPVLQRPKSAIFTYPSLSRSRLSSFRSLQRNMRLEKKQRLCKFCTDKWCRYRARTWDLIPHTLHRNSLAFHQIPG